MYCMLNFQIQLRVKMEWSEAMQKLRPSGGKPKWIPKHQRVKNSNSKARNAPVCSECGRPESKDATVPKLEEGGLEVPTCGKCEERAKNAQAFPSAPEEGGANQEAVKHFLRGRICRSWTRGLRYCVRMQGVQISTCTFPHIPISLSP